MSLVATMLDSFPAKSASDPEDPEGYELTLAAVLCSHPREVAEDCAEPKMGVVLECMGRRALTPGRVHDWCVRHSESLIGFVRREDERIAAARKAAADEKSISAEERQLVGVRMKAFVEEMKSRSRDNDRRQDEASSQRQDQMRRREAEQRDRFCLAEYARLGIAPVYDAAGRIANPSLLASMGKLPPRGIQNHEERPDGAEEAA
jgi:hypothetical protein